MASRVELQSELETALGSRNVYYQPPDGMTLTYPCIIYEPSSRRKTIANNKMYLQNRSYKITLVSKEPDLSVNDTILAMPYCTHDRSFKSDGLYHEVYNLFY